MILSLNSSLSTKFYRNSCLLPPKYSSHVQNRAVQWYTFQKLVIKRYENPLIERTRNDSDRVSFLPLKCSFPLYRRVAIVLNWCGMKFFSALMVLRTGQQVLRTFYWPQSHNLRMWMYTSFIDVLLAFLVLSGRASLLQFMLHDRLVTQCCLRLDHLHRYSERSMRTWNKHLKQLRD